MVDRTTKCPSVTRYNMQLASHLNFCTANYQWHYGMHHSIQVIYQPSYWDSIALSHLFPYMQMLMYISITTHREDTSSIHVIEYKDTFRLWAILYIPWSGRWWQSQGRKEECPRFWECCSPWGISLPCDWVYNTHVHVYVLGVYMFPVHWHRQKVLSIYKFRGSTFQYFSPSWWHAEPPSATASSAVPHSSNLSLLSVGPGLHPPAGRHRKMQGVHEHCI